MWDEMQRTLSSMCTPSKLTSFKIENFLALLDDLNNFIEVGEDFGGGESAHKLRASIRQLSKSYYEDFHQIRMDALKSCIENENFNRHHVKYKFSLKDIKEISPYLSEGSFSVKPIGIVSHKFAEVVLNGNPFRAGGLGLSQHSQTPRTNLNKADLDDDENEVLKHEVVEAPDKHNPTATTSDYDEPGPILTLSTITLVKFIGEYMGMMKSLSNVSWDVCQGMMQAVQFYTYGIFVFFGPSPIMAGLRLSPSMKNNLQQIQARFTKLADLKQQSSKLLPSVKLNDKVNTTTNTMYGLMQRCIAGESLLFLLAALNKVRINLQKLLPKQNVAQLSQFYVYSVDTFGELRLLLYKELCHKIIPADNMVSKVQAVDWNTTDIPMTHSSYIDTFSELLDGFKRRFLNLQKSISPPIPNEIQKTIWSSMISHIFDCLVEGYAATQCTNEGRAMMGIDFQNMQDKLTKLAPSIIQPIPHTKFVEAYIKAYYLQAAELEPWLKTHTEYSNKQLCALVNSGIWDMTTKRQCLKFLNSQTISK